MTTEELILGKKKPLKQQKRINYEDTNILYNVTNLQMKNKPITVTGDLVESFIGCKNEVARQDLKSGKKRVITYDPQGKKLFRVERI